MGKTIKIILNDISSATMSLSCRLSILAKLNFLVNKGEKDSNEAGHLLRAYQLTAPFETFKEMGKQTGIIFYTQASYTSKIDPVTGWRPNLYLKYLNNM